MWILAIASLIWVFYCANLYEEYQVVQDPSKASASQNVEELTAKHQTYADQHAPLYKTAIFIGKAWVLVPIVYLVFLLICWLIGNALYKFDSAEPKQPLYSHQALSMRVNYNSNAVTHNMEQDQKKMMGCLGIIAAIVIALATIYFLYKVITQ